MTELSHHHPPAMGIGPLHAASLTATIAVVVDRFLPSRMLGAAGGGRGYAQHSPARRPEPGCVDPPELEKEQR
jgi:hypothetical protein